MAKCAKCETRKAKRHCAALNADLCPLCCGTLREKDIQCSYGCPYLVRHRSYQEKKAVDKSRLSRPKRIPPGEDILQDERMAWLAFHIESIIRDHAECQAELVDRDVLLALEDALEGIEKKAALIFLPGEPLKPMRPLAADIVHSMESCRYERRIILPGMPDTYSSEDQRRCLERIILSVRIAAADDFDGRSYLQNLQDRFSSLSSHPTKGPSSGSGG